MYANTTLLRSIWVNLNEKKDKLILVAILIFCISIGYVEYNNSIQLKNIITELKASNDIQRSLLTYSISNDLREIDEKNRREK